jgi:type VI secretion system protein ImpF
MAELTSQERLQPSLLDRLTDTDPHNKTESGERRVLSVQRLRAGVLRDLAWLLNTGHLETIEDLEAYPYVRDSVLNYGIPDLSGLAVSGMETARLEKAVREAIMKFEPRIDGRSLKVSVEIDRSRMSRNSVVFKIEGQLWAYPAPLSLFLKTELDLETGDVTVSET